MIEKLFSSKARVAVLKLFLFNPAQSYYQRQIALLARLPIRAVQREVEKMSELGLLDSSQEGNRRYYRANAGSPLFTDLKSIFYKSFGIAEALRKAMQDAEGITTAFIYGSAAKGGERLGSDIDLMVIGSISSRQVSTILAPVKKEFSREINYAAFPTEEFRKRLVRKDHFLQTVVSEKKIFIIGNDNEFKKITRAR